jgi:hypothetical protein
VAWVFNPPSLNMYLSVRFSEGKTKAAFAKNQEHFSTQTLLRSFCIPLGSMTTGRVSKCHCAATISHHACCGEVSTGEQPTMLRNLRTITQLHMSKGGVHGTHNVLSGTKSTRLILPESNMMTFFRSFSIETATCSYWEELLD